LHPWETFRTGREGNSKGERRRSASRVLKLGTFVVVVDARKRTPRTGNRPTKSNRTVVVIWHGEPMRDYRSGVRRKSHRLRVEGELSVEGE